MYYKINIMFNIMNYQITLLTQIVIVLPLPIKVLDKGILPLSMNSVAMQFFLDFENKDKLNTCKIETRCNKCCLLDNENTDCDSVKVYGEYIDLLYPKDRKSFVYIYPSIIQLNQQGYCNFSLNYQCGTSSNKSELIKLQFDTRTKKKGSQYLLKNFKDRKVSHCRSIDEDPVNKCAPINCDLKYFGNKPFFNKYTNKCEKAVICALDPKKPLPNIIYEPISNTCKDLDHVLNVGDIYAINSGSGVVVVSNNCSNKLKATFKPNCSTISQHVLFLKDMLYGKVNPAKGYVVDFTKPCNDSIISILSTIAILSSLLLALVCCINLTVWLSKYWNSGQLRKKLDDIKSTLNKKTKKCVEKKSTVNKDLKSKLLKEVIVSDLPLELRNSVVDICERIGKEVRWKKRYRMEDVGSQINLKQIDDETDTSTTSDLDANEKEKLINDKH